MMLLDGRKVVFTNHAFDRMKEFKLDIKQSLTLLHDAERYRLKDIDKGLDKYTKEKYKDKNQEDTVYWINGTFNFVGQKANDKRSGEPIYLILTVTDTRVNLK